ncbi:hypothetical protein ACFV0B_15780 [Streptomyces xanthophaeus]|uniref:hypothetical protein n=1 Tax=Streptomyces xanthophaeus TaxID=67385 RepID=UPI003699D07B
MPEEDAPLLVVGAGIGGPATAVALGRRRIPASALVTGDPACGFRTHPGGAALRLRSGRRVSGRGIVAADGIDSPVRSRLYGAQPAVRSGTTCLRGLTTAAAGEQDDGQDGRPDDGQHSGAVRAWWGDRLQFGIIPLPAGRTSWFALAPTAVLTARQQDGPGGLAPPTGASSPGSPPRWRTCWRGPLRRARWRRNCAAARGAAVEDAAVLARRLDATPGTASAFRAYEAERRARVRRIQNQALRMNQLARLPAGPLSSLRDLAMASLPGPVERFAVRRMFDGPPPCPWPVRHAPFGMPRWARCGARRTDRPPGRTAP